MNRQLSGAFAPGIQEIEALRAELDTSAMRLRRATSRANKLQARLDRLEALKGQAAAAMEAAAALQQQLCRARLPLAACNQQRRASYLIRALHACARSIQSSGLPATSDMRP